MKLASLIAAVTLGLSCFTAPCIAAETTLSLNIPIPPIHNRWSNAVKVWCDELEKRTGGKVKVEAFFADSLTKMPEAFDGVKTGISDIAECSIQITVGQFPAHEDMFTVLDPSKAYPSAVRIIHGMWKEEPKTFEEFKDVKVIAVHSHPAGEVIVTREPVASLADLKGKKINITGDSLVSERVRSLGATAVSIPLADVYMAIQQGVIDGTISDFDMLLSRRFGDVARHMTLLNCSGTSFYFVMNKDVYDGLDDDIRKVVDELSGPWADRLFEEFWERQEFLSLQEWVDGGGVVHLLSDEDYAAADAACARGKEAWMQKMSDAGYDAEKLYHAIKKIEAENNIPWKDYKTSAYIKK